MNQEEEFVAVSRTLERLRVECSNILESWFLFEASNNKLKRQAMLDKINENGEAWGLNTLRGLAARDTILGICRILDRNSKDRETLTRVRNYLCRKGCLEILVQKARKWTPDLCEDYNESLVRRWFPVLVERMSEEKNVSQLGRHRDAFLDFRNRSLAHSLADLERFPARLNLVGGFRRIA